MAQAPVNAPLQAGANRRPQSNVPAEDTLSLKFIIEIVLSHKLWIILSVIVALIAGVLYLKRTTPLFSRYSVLLVNEKKKGMNRSINDQIIDMGLFGGNSNVNNEMQALQSPYLMYLVIKDLNLNVSYEEPHFFRSHTLYAKNPFSVKFIDADDRAASKFKVEILGPDSYAISDFLYAAPGMETPIQDDSSTIIAKAGAEVLTPIGKMVLSPNAYTPADSGRTIVVKKMDANLLADGYCSRLKVDLPDKLATVIKLTFVDDSPAKAEDVLNSIYDMYVQEQIEKKRKAAAITSKFIDSRLEIIENELGDIDKDIEKYKSGQLLTNVGAEGLSALQESNHYGQKILEVNNQLQVATFIKDYLNNSVAEQKVGMLPSNAGLNEGTVSKQIDEYNKLVIRRERLVANSSEKNPLVTEIDRNMQSMQVSILSSLDNLIHSLEVQMSSLKGKENEIKQAIARNPKQEKYLQTVGRQQKIKEALYLFLLQKREENELSGTIEAYNLDVITPPRGANQPISPKKGQVMLIALLIGFGLPTFIFWLIETLDETVRGKKDLTNLTLPFLGTIPLDGKIDEKRKGTMPVRIVVKDQSRDITNESFRVLRSNFLFMSEQSGERVILFTSYFPNSGKTFLSTNLALSLALSGKRVVVADFDMRKAELSKSLANKNHGVSSFLSGRETDVKSLIVNSGLHANMDILPCGILPPNPAELLMGDRLKELIELLKADYDYVFLDSTPLNIVADAATVGQNADLVVFAIREGRFLREALPDLEQLYKSNVFKRMATVLNGSFSGSGSYGRYHRYGRYGYGRYGYGRNSYGHYGAYGNAYGENPEKK